MRQLSIPAIASVQLRGRKLDIRSKIGRDVKPGDTIWITLTPQLLVGGSDDAFKRANNEKIGIERISIMQAVGQTVTNIAQQFVEKKTDQVKEECIQKCKKYKLFHIAMGLKDEDKEEDDDEDSDEDDKVTLEKLLWKLKA